MSAVRESVESMTLAEFCRRLKITKPTLYKLESGGLLRVIRLPIGKPRILEADYRAFLDRYGSRPSEAVASEDVTLVALAERSGL